MGCLLKASGLYSRTTIGAVLLAGGPGTRLGHRPKPLLELGGVPLVVRQLVALSGAGVDELVLVLGHHADAIEAAVASFPITVVRNPACTATSHADALRDDRADGDGGYAESVWLGLRALSPRLDAVIVAPADQPLIDAPDIVALIAAFKQRGDASIVVPRVRVPGADPRPGSPLIVDARLRDEWLAADCGRAADAGALPAAERVRWFDTDNRRYRLDIDTPDDLAAFTADTGHVLRWPTAFAEPAAAIGTPA